MREGGREREREGMRETQMCNIFQDGISTRHFSIEKKIFRFKNYKFLKCNNEMSQAMFSRLKILNQFLVYTIVPYSMYY